MQLKSQAQILDTALSPSHAGGAAHHDHQRTLQGMTELPFERLTRQLTKQYTVLDLGERRLSVTLVDVSAVANSGFPEKEALECPQSTTILSLL